VHIVASEYREKSKEKSPEPLIDEKEPDEPLEESKESSPPLPKETTPEPKELSPEPRDPIPEPKELSPEPTKLSLEDKESILELDEPEFTDETEDEPKKPEEELLGSATANHKGANIDLIKLTENIESAKDDSLVKSTEEFLNDAKHVQPQVESSEPKQSTPELLEEALKEESSDVEEDEEKASVKVSFIHY
jgi:hypothetical protein